MMLSSSFDYVRCRLALTVILIVTLIAAPTSVIASHFAYGTISWSLSPTPALPNHYLIDFEGAYRRDYGFTPFNPNVGQTVAGGQVGSLIVTSQTNVGPCCGKPFYDVCFLTYPSTGCAAFSQTFPLSLNILVVYPDDWMSGQTTGLSVDTPDITSNYMISFNMCCRVGGMTCCGGNSAGMNSAIIAGHMYSPRSTSFPRQYVLVNQPISWSVPSIHPLGWPMTYSLTPTAISQMAFTSPGTDYGTPGFSLDPGTGIVIWSPNRIGLYAVSFTMSAVNPANPSAGASSVVLDTIFSVVATCASTTFTCAHTPVFDPALPPTATFIQGSQATFTVTARSDDNHVLSILSSILPPGASLAFVSSVSNLNLANAQATWTTYQIVWTPTLSSVPATVCLTARDATSTLSSVGSNCVNFVFGSGSIIYVSGLMRDFHKSAAFGSYLTDFNRGDGDIGVQYVSSTLGSNNQPTFTGGAATTNAGNYANWYTTDPSGAMNLPQVYDIILNNATTSKGNIYVWNSGSDWFPIDQQLFGNEQDAHNRYFTLEIHSYITYTGGEVLVFQSSDDLLVFINKRLPANWNMGGVIASQTRSFSVQMDQMFLVSDRQKTMQIDIFYAHRSATGTPQLSMTLLSATLCNSLDVGLVPIALADFSQGANWLVLVGASSVANNKLQLMNAGASLAGAAWFTNGAICPSTGCVAAAYKVQHGFSAAFNFHWDGVTEGFAFVLQFDNGAAQGGQGSQLGYGGLSGIKNSIAIEFDGVQTTSLSDPPWSHVSIHSRFTQPNDASELYRVSGSVYSPQSTVFSWQNGTVHNVKVEYIPAVAPLDNTQNAPQLGWIRVYMGLAGGVQQAAPITSTQIDGVVLNAMWSSAAYVGFTAATSDTNFAHVYIDSFSLTIVPAAASKSGISSLPKDMSAGSVGISVLQLHDACNNPIKSGGDGAQITATLTVNGAPYSSYSFGNGIIDNGDGSYKISYAPTLTSMPNSPYALGVFFGGAPIIGSPFSFQVVPAATDPIKSTYTIVYNHLALGSPYPAAGPLGSATGSVGTITITARDIYGNLQTTNTDPFTVTFNPDIAAGGGMVSAPSKTGVSTYTSSFATPQPTTFAMYVRLNSINVQPSPVAVTFVAGAADATQSTASGSGLASTTVATTSTFTVTLRDASANPILLQNSLDKTCIGLGDGCVLKPLAQQPIGYASAIQSGLPALAAIPFTCSWGTNPVNQYLTCTYTTNVAYSYTVQVMINGVAMPTLSNTIVVIAAGAISAPNCVAVFPTQSTAGVSTTMYMQARDMYNNNVFVIPASTSFAVSFAPTIAFTGNAGTPAYSNYGTFTLAFVPTVASTSVNANALTATVNLAVSSTNTAIASSPFMMKVTPGPPDAASVVSGVATSVTAASGQGQSFIITSKDVYGNVRYQGGASTDYLVTLSSATQVFDQIATIAATTSQIYTVNWGTTLAGSYTMKVRVRVQSTNVASGSISVTVTPDVTVTTMCVASGNGIQGGIVGASVTVNVVAYDQFLNVQQPTVADTFRAVITSAVPATTTYTNLARDSSNLFYALTYTVPAPVTGGVHQYQIGVQRLTTGSGSTYVDLPSSPFTATSASSSTQLAVSIEGTQATTGTIGMAVTFNVVERDITSGVPKVGGLVIGVDIVSADGTLHIPNVGVSSGTATTSTFVVTFNPQFAFPSSGGNFLIKVTRGTVTAGAYSGVNPPSPPYALYASPYAFVLSAGAIYGPGAVISGLPNTVVAGVASSFSIALQDIYTNPVNYALAYPLIATLIPTSGTANTVILTGVASASKPITYTFASATPISAAAIYKVQITLNGAAMGSTAVIMQLTVNPDVPSALFSLVQPSTTQVLPASGALFSSSCVAGLPNTFAILVRDRFLNIINPALLTNGKIDSYVKTTLADTGTGANMASIGTPVYTGGAGAWTITFTSFVSNVNPTSTWPMSVSITNGASFIAIPVSANIFVVSSSISSSASYISGLSSTTSAGSSSTFTLNAFDAYSNVWNAGGISSIARDSSGASWAGSAVLSFGSNGAASSYAMGLPGSATHLAGLFTFDIRANGISFLTAASSSGPTVSMTVVAGKADATKTDVPAFLPFVLAGGVTTVTIGLRDAYMNIIAKPDAATIASISVNWPIDDGENNCINPSTDGYNYVDSTFNTLFVQPNGASLSFVSTRLGLYNVNITINGQSLDCSRLARLSLTVKPGPSAPSKSRVSGLVNVTANQPLTLTVTLYDLYSNQQNHGGDNVLVGQTYSDATPWSPSITSNSALWLMNTTIIDSGNGVYLVTARPTVATSYQIVVTLNNYLLQTFASSSIVNSTAAVTPLIYVSPNVPTKPSVINVPTIFAATPFVLTMQALDNFGNGVVGIAAASEYSYTISGQTTSFTDYTFSGALSMLPSGQYQWTALSALSGAVKLTISLVKLQSAYCLGRNAALPYHCSDFSCKATSNGCVESSIATIYSYINVLPATCAAQNMTMPYRCPPVDGNNCVAAYNLCNSLSTPACPLSAQLVQCATSPSTCVASAEMCPCPSGQSKCASGVCVVDITSQCHAVPSCPGSQVSCLFAGSPNGQCRSDISQCPSSRVCTPGYQACPDGNSCARDITGCATLLSPSVCPPGAFQCPNGRCTNNVADCATGKTCAAGSVLCLADGSCQSSYSSCPDQYQCYAPSPFRCADGSCRASADGCPSQTACPNNWVMCENNQCAQSLSLCIAANTCALNTIRCPGGSCVPNTMLCPSQLTCPQSSSNPQTVLCADHSCGAGVSYCVMPRVCPAFSTVCPDGSCSSAFATCPSTITCPSVTPVLCADGVSCTADATSCPSVSGCGITNPMRCPDGSCRGSLSDCPSRSTCPAVRPVRCADGSCVYSNQQCVNIPLCTSPSSIRCPGGECVSSFSLCPTHVTCPLASSRCPDGSCRASCTGVSLPNCPVGLTSCPLTSVGLLCVNSLSQCPLGFICPASAPVRCLDSSCASSISACPPLPPATLPEANKVPCPDGSWTTDASICNTPASCPASMPYKCWDESCRGTPSDCSVPSACSNPLLPYRCGNGACAASPYATDCRVVTESVTCGPGANMVKCPSTYVCVNDISQCSVSKAVSLTDSSTWASACPPSWARCRDGSCRMAIASCPAPVCPIGLPYQCANGVCALNLKSCPGVMSGCYAPLVGCPTNGACVSNLFNATQCPAALSTCYVQCADALCLSKDDSGNANGLCAAHKCSLRCADGTCGLPGVTIASSLVTATTTGNLCTAPSTIDAVHSPIANVCPVNQPYRCPSGLCVLSSLACFGALIFGNCPVGQPVQCANGACVVDSTQCAPVFTCPPGTMRCGDGSCRLSQSSDQGSTDCNAWGIPTSTCPIYKPTGMPRYRCANGLCSADSTMASCIDLSTGCPGGLVTRCPNGACIATTPRYSGFNNSVDACTPLMPAQSNGCALSTQSKCAYGGQCVNNIATDCPLPNGCTPLSPFRCTSVGFNSGLCVSSTANCLAPAAGATFQCADDSFVVSASSCNMLNGCPVATPFRCANGACAQYGASSLMKGATLGQVCQPTVICAAGAYLCYDGSCAATASLCPSSIGCALGQCADRSCVPPSPAVCATGILGASTIGSNITGSAALASCPPSVPILCDNGQCVPNVNLCPKSGSAGSSTGTGIGSALSGLNTASTASAAVSAASAATTNGGVANLVPTASACIAPTGVECFDGFCASTFQTCMDRAALIRGGTLPSSALVNSCPDQQIACSNGACVTDVARNQAGIAACASIVSCGSGFNRCQDGTCISGATGGVCTILGACPSVSLTGFQPVQTQRCQDGQCRYVCPAYDGCPHTIAPFQCANRECAINGAACSSGTAPGVGYVFQLAKPYLAAPLFTSRRLLEETDVAPVARSLAASASGDASGGYNSAGWCYSNCAAQVKASSYTSLVDVTTDQSLVIASDSSNAIYASLSISAGSLRINPSASTGSTKVSVTISPVADSVVRGSENRVASSRTDVAPSGYLTYVETVLSPMFNLAVDSSVQVPFATNLTVTATIDINHTPLNYSDICLAQLFSIPSIGFSAWQCVLNCQSTDGLNTPTRCPVRSSASVGPAWLVSSSVGQPGTYAFVEVPQAQPVPPSSLSWVQQNAIYLFLALSGIMIFMFFFVYIAQRLHRYRAKYHAERDAVGKQLEDLADMEDFGATAGVKDDETDFVSNPMVQQMKDVQRRLSMTQIAIREAEVKTKKEQDGVRKTHLAELMQDRDALAYELEGLRKEVMELAAAQNAKKPRQIEMYLNTPQYGQGTAMGALSMSTYSGRQSTTFNPLDDDEQTLAPRERGMTDAYNNNRNNAQMKSVRPKKRDEEQ